MSIVPYVQDSPEWIALRAKHIGASETAALFGEQAAYSLSHYALWMVKAGRMPHPEMENERTVWGSLLEPIIAGMVAKNQGWEVRKSGYATHDDYPGLGASLDYQFLMPGGEDGFGALDCKCVDGLIWRNQWIDGTPPPYIALQIQAQLAVTGWKHGCIASLINGNDLRLHVYKRREKVIDAIRERVAKFWQSIKEDNPPPIDGSDSTAQALRDLYYQSNEPPLTEILDLRGDTSFADACFEYDTASAAEKQSHTLAQAAKNRIIDKMGRRKKAITNGYEVSMVMVASTPDRIATPGEIIKGKAGYAWPKLKNIV